MGLFDFFSGLMPGTTDTSGTSNAWQPDTNSFQAGSNQAAQPVMSEHEALQLTSPTMTPGKMAASMPVNSISPSEANDYVQKMNKQYWDNKYDFGQGVGTQGSTASSQGAEVQPANTISPGLLDKMDQEKNSEWWKGQSPSGQQPGTTDESVTDQRVPIQPANSISPGLLDKYDVEQHSSFWNNENFKNQEDYKQALAKVKGDTRFTFNGNEYVRYGGRTYMSQNSIPNVAKLLSQDESERIDHLRSKLLLDKPIQDADGPGASLGAAAGRAAALGLAGTELPAILAGAGTAFVVKSLSNLRKDLMNNRH